MSSRTCVLWIPLFAILLLVLNVFLLSDISGNAPASFFPLCKPGGPPPCVGPLALAVINGGVRPAELFDDLFAVLKTLRAPIFVFSDEYNFNESRGDRRQSIVPAQKLYENLKTVKIGLHQWKINLVWYAFVPSLLRECGGAEAFLVMENDAVICDVEALKAAVSYFSSSNHSSLGLWDSDENKGSPALNISAEGVWLDLFKKVVPSGMVATLFKRRALLAVQKAMEERMFVDAIEGVWRHSGTMEYTVKNGQVLVHGGRNRSNGGETRTWNCPKNKKKADLVSKLFS